MEIHMTSELIPTQIEEFTRTWKEVPHKKGDDLYFPLSKVPSWESVRLGPLNNFQPLRAQIIQRQETFTLEVIGTTKAGNLNTVIINLAPDLAHGLLAKNGNRQ